MSNLGFALGFASGIVGNVLVDKWLGWRHTLAWASPREETLRNVAIHLTELVHDLYRGGPKALGALYAPDGVPVLAWEPESAILSSLEASSPSERIEQLLRRTTALLEALAQIPHPVQYTVGGSLHESIDLDRLDWIRASYPVLIASRHGPTITAHAAIIQATESAYLAKRHLRAAVAQEASRHPREVLQELFDRIRRAIDAIDVALGAAAWR